MVIVYRVIHAARQQFEGRRPAVGGIYGAGFYIHRLARHLITAVGMIVNINLFRTLFYGVGPLRAGAGAGLIAEGQIVILASDILQVFYVYRFKDAVAFKLFAFVLAFVLAADKPQMRVAVLKVHFRAEHLFAVRYKLRARQR